MTASGDPLERVLRMVAEGQLSADEAAPIIDALQANAAPRAAEPAPSGEGGRPRFARIEVQEGGRQVVNLRVPISLGRLALARVPGLSADQIAEVEAAVAGGSGGPILDVQDSDGDGVRIILE